MGCGIWENMGERNNTPEEVEERALGAIVEVEAGERWQSSAWARGRVPGRGG